MGRKRNSGYPTDVPSHAVGGSFRALCFHVEGIGGISSPGVSPCLDRLIAAPVGILMHKQGELPLTTVATRRRLDYKPSCLSKHLAEILTQF